MDGENTAKMILCNLIQEFTELNGDRKLGDDISVCGGIGYLHDIPVTVIAHNRGRTLAERIQCNFSMTTSIGFKKSERLCMQAEKFQRPIIQIVDTVGAHIEDENNIGQHYFIASHIKNMLELNSPIGCIIAGNALNTAALAMSISDYCVLVHSGTLDYTTSSKFPNYRTNIDYLVSNEIIDDTIILEDYAELKDLLYVKILKLRDLDIELLKSKRYHKYRNL